MNLAISVPWREGLELAPWLEVLAPSRGWDGIELPGAIMQDDSGWEDLLDTYNLTCLTLNGLLPEEVARYLPETEELPRRKLVAYIRDLLARAAVLNMRFGTLDMGMDRVAPEQVDAQLAPRTQLLRSLMSLAEAHDITACVPTRLPVPPFRPRLLEHTVRLVNEVMHPHCRLALNVIPEDLPPTYAPGDLVKEYAFVISLVRFHYEPALGIPFPSDQQREWAKALRWHGYRGAVVFCPVVHTLAQFRTEVQRLECLIAEVWRPAPANT